MRTVEEHARIVAALIARTPAEPVPLQEAAGLVLAADLIAPIDLPPFANSAMDGYAVRAADVANLPAILPVSQDIPAGRSDTAPLAVGTAARIMTGAPLPPGAELVVPVELTSVEPSSRSCPEPSTGSGAERAAGSDSAQSRSQFVPATGGRVRIEKAPQPGAHIRAQGDDVAVGTVVLHAGTVIGATQIGVAAALGCADLMVFRPPRVLLLSTGSELVSPGDALGPGQIYESNSAMLAAAMIAIGVSTSVLHFVADDVDSFRSTLSAALQGIDLVVTSGGVSAGAYEVVKDALAGQGVEFVKVAMQPGMPQGAGHVGAVPIVTLPGNPVSSYVSFEVFLRPALRAAMGHPDPHRPTIRVPLSTALDSPAGKRQFRRGVLDAVAGTVAPWGGPGSHLLSWLAGADAIIVVPEDVTHLDAGEQVDVWLLDES